TAGEVSAAAPAWGVREKWGVVWLAPAEPRGADLEPSDPGGTWLPAVRTSVPAAVLADGLLDPTPAVPEVVLHEGGFTGTWAGGRAAVATPFQLRRQDDGTARSVLVLLQPEDADSTRVYLRVTLPGASRTDRAAAVATQRAELSADLRRLQQTDSTGLPLTMREELHVPADRLGVALRRTLADWVVGLRAPAPTVEPVEAMEADQAAA
ncbi:MAG: Rieske (2Fe-2S) iron-sulfur domain Ferredoxin, partial [Klenkia sp.]|nr:Rieske (2Fe-2S) iron-sulfur domain Ferredoxin [Klenkia sp.]